MNKGGNRTENVLGLCTLVTLVIAALIGLNRSSSEITTHLHTLVPGADQYQKSGFGSGQSQKVRKRHDS